MDRIASEADHPVKDAVLVMNRQEVDTALAAANVALAGRPRREASSFASIELRSVAPDDGRWEIVAGSVVALVALVTVVAAWLY